MRRTSINRTPVYLGARKGWGCAVIGKSKQMSKLERLFCLHEVLLLRAVISQHRQNRFQRCFFIERMLTWSRPLILCSGLTFSTPGHQAVACNVYPGNNDDPKTPLSNPRNYFLVRHKKISPEEKVKAVNLMGDEESDLPHRKQVRRQTRLHTSACSSLRSICGVDQPQQQQLRPLC